MTTHGRKRQPDRLLMLTKGMALLCLCGLPWPSWSALASPERPGGQSHAIGKAARHPTRSAEPAKQRAITLAPHVTELLYAAGAGDRIIATVNSSDYPPQAHDLPRIGDGLHVSVEKAMALAPDVIIAWQPSGAARTLASRTESFGIPLLYSRPTSLDGIAEELERWGSVFGTELAAHRAAHTLRSRLEALRAQYAHKTPVSVFIQVGSPPLYTVADDAVLQDVLASCAATNVYSGAKLPALQVSREHVVLQQPQMVVAPTTDSGKLKAIEVEWANLHLEAARRGHVYGIDGDMLFRPGPRLIDAAQTLCHHVDQVRDDLKRSEGRPHSPSGPK